MIKDKLIFIVIIICLSKVLLKKSTVKSKSNKKPIQSLLPDTDIPNLKIAKSSQDKKPKERKEKCLPKKERLLIKVLCIKDYIPVCGYYGNSCKEDYCKKTFDNQCLACSDLEITHYTEGECQYCSETIELPNQGQKEDKENNAAIIASKQNDSNTCFPKINKKKDEPEFCFLIYAPVCGISKDCMKDISKCTTFSNSCFACLEDGILFYLEGICDPSIITNDSEISIAKPPDMDIRVRALECTADSRSISNCPEEYIPVCGVTNECENDHSQCTTFNNGCYSCIDPLVKYFFFGECPYKCPSLEERIETKCLPEQRNAEICTMEFHEVCGVTNDCMFDIGSCITYSNPCAACSPPEVNYYFEGKCCTLFNTEPEPLPFPEIDPFFNRKFCDQYNRPKECIIRLYDPVCAFKIGCDPNISTCMQTKNSPCEACLDEKTIEYSHGPCPEPAYCTDESRFKMCTMQYIGVCAMKFNCEPGIDNDCNFNTGTGCQACSNPEVEKYYNYECWALTSLSQQKCYIEPMPLPISVEMYKCTPEDRGATCTDEYTGVCAHKADECTSDCQFTASNICTACSNPEIIWVEKIECNKDWNEQIFIKNSLDIMATNAGETTPIPPEEETPKSWLKIKSNARVKLNKLEIVVNITNSTNTYNVEQAYKCNDNDRMKHCASEFKPVCAYKSCNSGRCPIEKSNECLACLDNTVDYLVNKDCKNIGNSRIFIPCGKQDRSTDCFKNEITKFEVCGRYTNSTSSCNQGQVCEKNFVSVCDACGDSSVMQYYEGECLSIKLKNIMMLVAVLLVGFII